MAELDLALRDVRDAAAAVEAARARLRAATARQDETIRRAHELARYGDLSRVVEASGMTPNAVRAAAARARRAAR